MAVPPRIFFGRLVFLPLGEHPYHRSEPHRQVFLNLVKNGRLPDSRLPPDFPAAALSFSLQRTDNIPNHSPPETRAATCDGGPRRPVSALRCGICTPRRFLQNRPGFRDPSTLVGEEF
jgi:hypothetical protein